MKIIVWGCLISQMKHLDALITTQNLNSLKCTVAEKIKKIPQKTTIFFKLKFLVFSSCFFSNGKVLRVGFFCVLTIASRR